MLTQPSESNADLHGRERHGHIAAANVTNVAVTALAGQRAASRARHGDRTAGTGLVLRNNGGDDLAITADGEFAFATRLQPALRTA